MNLKLDLLQRSWHWISDSPLNGHIFGCMAIDKVPDRVGQCNCGRDRLLDEIAAVAFAPVDSLTNGHTL